MTKKNKSIIAVVSLAIAFATGRYTVSEKIVTKIVEVESKTKNTIEDTNKNKNKQTIIVATTKPDGEKTITTTINEVANTTNKIDTTSTDNKKTDTEKTVTKGGNTIDVSALFGYNFLSIGTTAPQILYGAHVQTGILGPMTVGVWALSSPSAGFSLGLRF